MIRSDIFEPKIEINTDLPTMIFDFESIESFRTCLNN
jgi:hypothetical protein